MGEWDDKINGYGPIKQTKCGENRFIGVKNILGFYITDGCTLQIQPRDAIQTLVRMEWSFDEFYSEGGTTSFVDRLAGSLGIHASTIKVVSVYDGSLVVNYELAPSKEEKLSLDDIKKKQTKQFAEGTVNLGAPILDVAAGKEKVVADGVVTAQGFKPKVLTKTPTNSNAIARRVSAVVRLAIQIAYSHRLKYATQGMPRLITTGLAHSRQRNGSSPALEVPPRLQPPYPLFWLLL